MTERVCILTSVHPVFDPRIFLKQARTLVRAGYAVTLIAQHERNETVDGVGIVALSKPHNRFQRVMSTFRVFRKARALQASVYHFHDPELLPAGLMLKLTTKAKVIYDVHEDYSESLRNAHYLPGCLRPVMAGMVSCIEKLIVPRLDGVISATDEIGRKFRNHRSPMVIHNYPIVAGFQERRNKPQSDVLSVVYAGVMTRERGLVEVVQALAGKESVGIRLTLYGKCVPAAFEDELRRLPGAEKVDFKGFLPPEEAWRALADGDAGIVCFHPGGNHDLSMPNKLFEYMIAALPVVASNFNLWKEIVEGNHCGLTVNPLSLDEIASALKWLKRHPVEAGDMGRNGRNAVLRKYSWESEGARLVDFYRRITGRMPDIESAG